ncbi:MAG: aryl-sulfate sulfotransferase [Acidobacteriales bacterium]|nr:aryl-sulfate sulfotransferase [Terriglobales bacterium]
MNSGIELLHNLVMEPASKLTAVATDLDGNPIWYYDPGAAGGTSVYTMKLLNNGHFLLTTTHAPEPSGILREIDLAGNTIRELSSSDLNKRLAAGGFNLTENGFHHDFIPLDNGHVIALVLTTKDFTDLPGYPGTTTVTGDAIIDLDANFNPVWTWSSFDYLDVNRHLQGLPDWTHSNALVYDPSDGNLLISMRHQSWILKVDYQNGGGTGAIVWKLGQDGDFALAGGDPTQWFYAQHYPALLSRLGSQLNMAVFDNGNFRLLDSSGSTCIPFQSPVCYSRATIFQVDEAAKTAQLNWQFLPGAFSFWGGSINQLENGNVEFAMSQPNPTDATSSTIMEVTQTPTPQVVWQMNVEGANSYRGYRIPSLYPGVAW